MANYTPNLNLGKPESSDQFKNFRQLFNDNMDKIDNAVSGGDTVTWNQIQVSGTKIAEIDINGTTTDVYAPDSDLSALLQGMAVGKFSFDSNVIDDRDYDLVDDSGNFVVARQTILFERE